MFEFDEIRVSLWEKSCLCDNRYFVPFVSQTRRLSWPGSKPGRPGFPRDLDLGPGSRVCGALKTYILGPVPGHGPDSLQLKISPRIPKIHQDAMGIITLFVTLGEARLTFRTADLANLRVAQPVRA